MSRERLRNRRRSITMTGDYAGSQLTVSIGLYPDGRPGEVFGNIGRAGNELERTMNDACIALSIALQNGATSKELSHTIAARAPGREPSSIVGAVVELLAEYDQERAA